MRTLGLIGPMPHLNSIYGTGTKLIITKLIISKLIITKLIITKLIISKLIRFKIDNAKIDNAEIDKILTILYKRVTLHVCVHLFKYHPITMKYIVEKSVRWYVQKLPHAVVICGGGEYPYIGIG